MIVFFISSLMVSNGLTPKVMVCVTGISSGIDCEGTQDFVVSFSFSFARRNGAGSVSMLVEIVFGNGRDLNKSLIFGWKTFFRGKDGGSFK